MTKAEIEELHFVNYLKWCRDPQTDKPNELLFWLDYKYPTYDNFWEWVVRYKKYEESHDES